MKVGEPLETVGVAASGVGAALLAAVSAACCTGPVVAPRIVAVLGAGGAAWAAGLRPYAPYLFAGSLGLLLYGFWSFYGAPARCRAGGRCAGGRSRVLQSLLWWAAAVWLGAVGYALWANYLVEPVI